MMIKKVKVEDINHQGYGIVRINNRVIFVKNVIPGDVIDIEIVKNYKNYSIGEVVDFIIKSNDHDNVKCQYYGLCGGCQISHIKHENQLKFKREKIKNIFYKYLKLDIDPDIISVNSRNYRNKVVFHVEDNNIGFYEEGTNKLIPIQKCLLLDNRINSLVKLFYQLDLTYVEKIMVRTTSKEVMVVFYGYIDKFDILKDKVDSIILINIKEKLLYGKGYIKEEIDNIKFIISHDSFFQVNTDAMIKLYDKILEYANLTKEDSVLDLYCGTGTIGIYLSKYCKEVLGIEIVESAIKDANINKELNNISNISFVCGDVSRLIDNSYKQDVLIVDPPRSGLDKKTRKVILDNEYNKIVYVSCDPMTLVRDLVELSSKYDIKDIALVDMFPNTYHVETVILLSRKINVHNMKLNSSPFEMIKCGQKTIELRLYDEKRQQVKIGDKIVFTNTANGETLNTTVVKMHRFDSFKELYKSLPLLKCGYTTENVGNAKPSDMEQYYSVEEQRKYGVVGIELCQPKQITD